MGAPPSLFMSEILQKALASMTRGANMRGVLIKSSALAVSSTIVTIPYFYYMVFIVQGQGNFSEYASPWYFLFAELFLLFIICFLSAMVGFSFYRRYDLPGFGDLSGFADALPLLLAWATVMVFLSYFLFDRYFMELSPVSYPKDKFYLIFFPFQGAFTDEIILRFCLVTISVGLFRNKWLGIVFVSVLASIFTLKYFNFIGVTLDFGFLLLAQLFLSFLSNLLLGYFFVTRGLIFSMALKFMFGMKYIVALCAI